jgi:LEA14-like dessication related protein
MNKTKALLLTAGAGLALFAFKKKDAADSLTFYPDRVAASMDGITPEIVLRLAVENPSSTGFQVDSFVGSLYTNGYLIGNASSFSVTNVAPKSVSYFTVIIRLSVISLAADVYNTIVNKTGLSQAIKLVGKANVDGVLVPISIDYKIL